MTRAPLSLWLLVTASLACAVRPDAEPRAAEPSPRAASSASARAEDGAESVPTARHAVLPRAPLGPVHEARIAAIVSGGIGRGHYPGAVVLAVREGEVALERAFGARALQPTRVPMTADTVFDVASLTKPVATATAVLVLRDEGRLALHDPVSHHLPSCPLDVTIEELLTHRSGLPAANALSHYTSRASALAALCALPRAPRGQELYSDLGYILLGELVERVAGLPFAAFCRDRIFVPLGMHDTGFRPGAALRARAAPTELRGDVWLTGVVHDPRAAALEGVAGHAGLFSTAADLGRWVNMLLGGGELEGKRVLSDDAVTRMLSGAAGGTRSLGLERAPIGGFGHTGFTGTSLWLDPARGVGLVLLASRLHPHGEKGSVTALRRDVRAALVDAVDRGGVSTGIDNLRAQGFAPLAGRKVGLITNASGRARDGATTRALLHQAPDVTLVALFTPEHGLAATEEGAVGHGVDATTGVPIYSLYGASARPTKAQLAGVDTLVFDVQGVGARFFTYVTTLGYALETAALHGLPLMVLDRPNPLGGVRVEGPPLEASRRSFVGYHTIPIRHGMTMGELARLFDAERKLGAALTVVPVTGWKRSDLFADTGLPWVNPSPNLKSPEAALLYPGLALLELTNVSVGRGTDAPFLRIGAPWIDAAALRRELAAAKLAGLAFSEDTFVPTADRFAGKTCHGLRIAVLEPHAVDAVRLGVALAVALVRLHPTQWQRKNLITLWGHRAAVDAVAKGRTVDEVIATWQPALEGFASRRDEALLY